MVEDSSKSERVYRELHHRIISGRYAPGVRLILSRLAEEFDVSAVPVREAIRRLEAEGFITFTHNVGAEVAPIDINSYRETMLCLMYLESAATALSAPHLDAEDIKLATSFHEQMKALVHEGFDPFKYSSLNGQFHMQLCSKCPNERLLALLRAESARAMMIRRSEFRFTLQRSLESVRQHGKILSLIQTGAPEGDIENYLRQHKLDSMRALGILEETN